MTDKFARSRPRGNVEDEMMLTCECEEGGYTLFIAAGREGKFGDCGVPSAARRNPNSRSTRRRVPKLHLVKIPCPASGRRGPRVCFLGYLCMRNREAVWFGQVAGFLGGGRSQP